MRAADDHTIDMRGVSASELMENAGREAVAVLAETFGPVENKHIVILAGKGNNGGDGLVIARLLHELGAIVEVFSVARPDNCSTETAANLAELVPDDRLRLCTVVDGSEVDATAEPDLIVDALLGVGVEGELREPVLSLAKWANNQSAPTLAIDIPSGLNSTTGIATTDTIVADSTIAIAALKSGHLLHDGPRVSGSNTVVDIGIPADVLDNHATAFRATNSWISETLPRRAQGSHKYDAGVVLAVCGSRQYTGAAVLSTLASYRAGAGAVLCCTSESARVPIDVQATEVMVDGLQETGEGTLTITAYDAIVERFEKADSVLIGCGLGRLTETNRLVQALIRRVAAPTVVDADGLRALADKPGLLKENSEAKFVLTPHEGEFSALVKDLGLENKSRLEATKLAAQELGATIVRKGMPTIVATPDGRLFIGPAGNTALATAGTGDVLAGMIAAYLSQGLEPAEASLCALHVGTAAADRYTTTRGASSMRASDLLFELPFALKERFGA